MALYSPRAAILVAIQLFVPVARLVSEDQDPFLIKDMHRLSRELEATLLRATREESVSEEDKELFERARELSRRMDAKTIDPSYLQDELLRLTRGVERGLTGSGLRTIGCLHSCWRKSSGLDKIRKAKVCRHGTEGALDELSRKTRDMQELSVQQRLLTAQSSLMQFNNC